MLFSSLFGKTFFIGIIKQKIPETERKCTRHNNENKTQHEKEIVAFFSCCKKHDPLMKQTKPKASQKKK